MSEADNIETVNKAIELLARALPFLQGRTTEDRLEGLIEEILDFIGP